MLRRNATYVTATKLLLLQRAVPVSGHCSSNKATGGSCSGRLLLQPLVLLPDCWPDIPCQAHQDMTFNARCLDAMQHMSQLLRWNVLYLRLVITVVTTLEAVAVQVASCCNF